MSDENMNDAAVSGTPIQSMTSYVVANVNGEIVMWGSMPHYMISDQSAPDGGSVVLGEGQPKTHYVKNGQSVARPANPAVLDGVTLKSLPVPCTITLEGVDHECTDDTCELSFSHPGTYPVKVSAWPMLDATFEVTQA
jgi:hypothetical protein